MLDASQQRGRQRSRRSESDTSTLNGAVTQLHFEPVVRQNARGLIGPLDCHDGRSREIVTQANQFRFLLGLQSVQIDVNQRQTARVFMQ
jgi:hypothetical protein